MRIGIDYRLLSPGRVILNRGMGRYTQQQLREVLRLDSRNEYILVCRPDHDIRALLPEIAAAPNASMRTLPESLACPGDGATMDGSLRRAAELQDWLAGERLDLFHATTPFLFVEPMLCRFDACPLVATHYDLIPLVYPSHYLASPAVMQKYLWVAQGLRHADRLIAISHFVRREAVAYLGASPARVDVAYPVADPCFKQLPMAEVERSLEELRRRGGFAGEFLLTVSHSHHSKNLSTLLRGYSLLPPEWRKRYPLVVACDLHVEGYRLVESWARELHIERDLVFTGFTSDEELVALFNAAFAVLHASRYEGFGLPALEAMKCGAAVVASRAAALPEVVGDAGLLVDPDDPVAFAGAIDRLSRDRGLRQALREAALERAASFASETLGQATLEAYQRTVEAAAETARRPSARPRLALWTPLPPQESGIADYSAELLPALAEWADVEVFVDGGFLPAADLLDRWPVFHHAAFARRQRRLPYDLVIYQMGASPFHVFIAEALRRWPGLVVLHDLTWSHQLYYSLSLVTGRYEPFRRLLAAQEGEEALAELVRIEGLDPAVRMPQLEDFLDRHYMLREVIDASRAQIVHLPRAKQELEERYAGARVHLMPMGVKDPLWSLDGTISELRREAGFAAGELVIGAFGIADHVKRLESVVRAVARLMAEVAHTRLLIVGGFIDPGYRGRLEALAAEIGVADRVQITGWVPRQDFDRLLLACDVVVNLRFPFRKQASANVLRAAAAGKPLVVTDVPEWDFLPASFCCRIPADETEEAALAGVLGRLAGDGELARRMSRAARDFYLAEATLERMSRNYRTVVEELVGHPLPEPTPMPGTAPPSSPLGYNKVCEAEDFARPELSAAQRELYPDLFEIPGAIAGGAARRRKAWEAALCLRALRDFGVLRPDASLLGAGAGAGPLAFHLTMHAGRVFATDLYLAPGSLSGASPLMLTEPEKLATVPFDRRKLVVQHMDGRVLDYPEGSFDGVFSLSTVEHLEDLRAAAAAAFELGRVLKPGGILALSTDYLVAGPPGARGWRGNLLFDTPALARYLVEASGLVPVDEPRLAVSELTLTGSRPLNEAGEATAGGSEAQSLLSTRHGQVFGSVLLVLRKTDRYPMSDNAWAAPTPEMRAQVQRAAAELGDRLLALRSAPRARQQAPPARPPLPLPADESGVSDRPPAPLDERQIAIAARFEQWNEIRSRHGLEEEASGPLPRRVIGFLGRTAGRVRDLGTAWDLERDVLRGLIDEQVTLGRRLHLLETPPVREELRAQLARLWDEAVGLREEIAGLRDEAARRLAGLEGEREQAALEREDARRRIDGLRMQAAALEERAARGLGRQQVLEIVREQLAPWKERLSGLAPPRRTADSKAGGERAPLRHPGAELAGNGAARLAPDGLPAIVGILERELPRLAHSRAVDVSIQDVAAEDLLFAAHRYFGGRMAGAGIEYRAPNDLWLHVDFTADRTRPILLDNAAARLARGGYFVLVTGPPTFTPGTHEALRLARSIDLPGAVRALAWERL